MTAPRWLPKDGKDARTWLLFIGGLAGVTYETLAAQGDRPYLLVIFASMMGLPLFLRRDEPPHPPPGLPEAMPRLPSARREPRSPASPKEEDAP